MNRCTAIVSISALAVALAACDQQAGQAGKFAKPAEMPPKNAVADIAKPAEDFKSTVTPTPKAEAGGPQPGSPQPADAELSSKVKSALMSSPEVNTGALEVAASNGVVTLYGTVEAPVEKERAAMLAMGVDGVRSVVNNLVVVKGS
ncbi:MAG: BON domain-containing protein [Betaproteobacteria bacterium]|nr:BON domain-containing protein [Betaproteobacteria bacterium]